MLRILSKFTEPNKAAEPNLADPVLSHGEALSRRARLWMFWERFAPVLALAALLSALFMAGAFAGLWQRIGDPWRLMALITALYFLIRAAIAARAVAVPSKAEARRRIERDSGAAHRPLETLRDRAALIAQNKDSRDSLWTRHQEKARMAAKTLGPAKPVPVIAPKDKYYLRFIAPALLLFAGVVGYGDNQERLRRALTPSWQSALNPATVTFDAWVDPPDYTGRPPVYFKGKQTVNIPEGSELVARLQGAQDAPRLKLTGNFGFFSRKYLSLNRLGPDSFEARTTLKRDVKAIWRIGQKRREWTLNVIPDRAPEVDWAAEPRADKRDRLSFQYRLSDDYGVERLALEMRLLSGVTGPISSKVETVTIPLTGSSVRETDGTDAALDLTKHVWAGRKVAGRLVAVDGKGQTARSPEAFFTIADKIFIEPIAKAAAEQRQLIIAGLSENGGAYLPFAGRTAKEWSNQPRAQDWDFERSLGRAPAPIQRAATLMEAIMDYPMGLYNDPAVYMGLRHSLSTLRHAQAPDALKNLPADLWQIAIRAEYGVLGTALEEMREAQANLNEGMARQAPQREIDTLFERYNEAVDRYVEELKNNAEETEASDEQSGGGRNVDEIAELLKAIEQANKEGDSEGARVLLKKLAEFLENMKIQMAQGGQGGEGGDPSDSMSEEMKESLEDLADLLGEERELKDETQQAERQAQAGEQGGEGSGQAQSGQNQSGQDQGNDPGAQGGQTLSSEDLAERQAALAELLERARKKLDENANMRTSGGKENGEDSQNGGGDENGEDGGGDQEDGQEGPGGGAPGESEADNPRGGGNSDDPARDPDSALGDAAQAMRDAQEALKSENFEAAQNAQQQAIAALREAASSLLAQANDGAESEDGEAGSANAEGNPLDQAGETNNDFSDADLEQRENAERSREILKELRRRASEQEREQSEKDYLEDLLKRF